MVPLHAECEQDSASLKESTYFTAGTSSRRARLRINAAFCHRSSSIERKVNKIEVTSHKGCFQFDSCKLQQLHGDIIQHLMMSVS
jgi:hypothetical protein